jgi:hypothetical protein
MNQSSRLQDVFGSFIPHVLVRNLSQFLINERNQLIKGVVIAVTPSL